MYGAVKLHKQLQFIRLEDSDCVDYYRTCWSKQSWRVLVQARQSYRNTPGANGDTFLQLHISILRICAQTKHNLNTESMNNWVFFFSGKARAVTKAKAGVMCSLVWHLDPKVYKKGFCILYFSHARVDLVKGNIFTNLTVWLQQHIDSNVIGYCWHLVVQVCKKPPGWWFNAPFM